MTLKTSTHNITIDISGDDFSREARIYVGNSVRIRIIQTRINGKWDKPVCIADDSRIYVKEGFAILAGAIHTASGIFTEWMDEFNAGGNNGVV